jgi:phosphoglucomutase
MGSYVQRPRAKSSTWSHPRIANIRMGVDPLGGAGVHYWARIADLYKLDLHVVNDEVDPTFGFMSLDWDGKDPHGPSSPYAMRRLIGLKDDFDIAFACDTDHDRHGIVTASGGFCRPTTTCRWPSITCFGTASWKAKPPVSARPS